MTDKETENTFQVKSASSDVNFSELAIRVQDLTKVYKLYSSPLDRLKESINPFGRKYHHDFHAIDKVSFDVKKGETVGIIGQNGSGKSTLLKTITGVLTPTSGAVSVNGRVSALLELGAGFNPELTGIENIYFNGILMGYLREEMECRMDDILSFADIGEFVHQPVKTYSSGMFIRLAFAVAINVDPDILIVDEALAVGDELFQRKCFAKIRKFSEDGKTILFVTHSGSTIIELCNRALFFDAGELLVEGSPKLVVSLYHKLLYSKPENLNKLRNEIKNINKSSDYKLSFDMPIEDQPEKLTTHDIERNNWHQELTKQKPYLWEGLTSQSFLEYKVIDIEVTDIQVKTISDEKVNALVMDEDYVYSFYIKFAEAATNVYFGMCFKNKTGVEIGWCEAMRDNSIPQVLAGQVYLVEWHFKCSLLPGTYFSNLSVKSYVDGKKTFLCRITDALAFQVQDIPHINYGGMIHFNQFANVTKL